MKHKATKVCQAIEMYRIGHVYKHVKSVETAEISLSWVNMFFGEFDIADLDQSHIDKYIESREGRANATIRRELVMLIAALNIKNKLLFVIFNSCCFIDPLDKICLVIAD